MGGPTTIFQKMTLRRRRQTEFQQTRDKLLFGSLGAASPVRKIDPNTGAVVALIDPGIGAILSAVRTSTKLAQTIICRRENVSVLQPTEYQNMG
jgi:hypothetical protein